MGFWDFLGFSSNGMTLELCLGITGIFEFVFEQNFLVQIQIFFLEFL